MLGIRRGVVLITRHAPESIYARSALTWLALIGLAAWTSPALASAGAKTLCDQSVQAVDMPDAGPDRLSIDVVNHAPADVDVDIDPAIDSSLEEDAATGRPKSRVELLLRKIFDEPQLRTIDAPVPEGIDEMTAPLAVDKADVVDETKSTTGGEESSETATGLPGVSEQDFARYKRQMYRTDI